MVCWVFTSVLCLRAYVTTNFLPVWLPSQDYVEITRTLATSMLWSPGADCTGSVVCVCSLLLRRPRMKRNYAAVCWQLPGNGHCTILCFSVVAKRRVFMSQYIHRFCVSCKMARWATPRHQLRLVRNPTLMHGDSFAASEILQCCFKTVRLSDKASYLGAINQATF
jgi:hypothetical protein